MEMCKQHQALVEDGWQVEKVDDVQIAGNVNVSIWKATSGDFSTYDMVYQHHADGSINTKVITSVSEEAMEALGKMFLRIE
jgi:hypothetical protein